MKNVTETVLSRQMIAMGGETFEVGAIHRDTQETELRTWTRREVIASISWLKYKNINHYHIYIRPLGSTGLILLDDLTITQLQAMEAQGIYSACTVITSEFNYQAWVRISPTPIEGALATAIGEVLANRFNADLGAKAWRQFGRAVGFTNVKRKHVQDDGRYPFVRLYGISRKIVTQSAEIIAESRLLVEQKEKADDLLAASVQRSASVERPSVDPSVFFDAAVQRLLIRYGVEADHSRVDWSAGKHMMLNGYSFEDIAEAMLANESIRERKKGHVRHYVLVKTLPRLFGMGT